MNYPRLERSAWSSAVLLAGLLAFMPLAWQTLASFGGYRLKIAHVWLALLGVNVAFQVMTSASSFRIRRSPLLVFSLMYTGYLVFLLLATSVSRYPGAEPDKLIKYLAYFAGFLVIYVAVASNQRSLRQLSVGVTLGSLLSITLFSLIAIIVFSRLHRDFFGECFWLLLGGKATKLQFSVYPVLFRNAVLGAGRSTIDAEFSTSLRNTLVGAFICSIQLTWIFRPVAARVLGRALSNLILWSVTLCGSFLVVTSVSRSNVAVLGLTFVLACLLTLGVTGRNAQRKVIGNLVVLATVCMLATALFAAVSPGIVDLVQRRFTQGSPERMAIAHQALREISEEWLMGRGIGIHPKRTDLEIHNLFLAAWHNGGLATFLMSLGFYLVVVVVWLRAIGRRFRDPASWKLDLSANWVLTLPLLPLFRAQISGEGGNFTMIEWACLAFFFALMSCNASAAEVSESRLVPSPKCAADFTASIAPGYRADECDLSQAS